MKLINKSAPPPSFVTYTQTNLGVSFEDMDAQVKQDLRISLLNEQGWICGYCQQKIKDVSKMTIEHHCEQTICNGQNGYADLRLDYTNMMAVCLGKAGYELHCDTQKATLEARSVLPIEVSPWNSAHMAAIVYKSTGLVESTIDRHDNEINVVLHLNITYLKERRKDIWLDIYKRSSPSPGIVNRDKMRRLTETGAQMVGNMYKNPFPGLYDFMCQRFC